MLMHLGGGGIWAPEPEATGNNTLDIKLMWNELKIRIMLSCVTALHHANYRMMLSNLFQASQSGKRLHFSIC